MHLRHTFFLLLLFSASAVAGETTPSLTFVKQIGNAQGRSLNNISVDTGAEGQAYLLQSSGRIVVFNTDGAYKKSLHADLQRLNWRHRQRYLAHNNAYLLTGTCEEDYPWVYAADNAGVTPGRFSNPQSARADRDGYVYVADCGNKRVQMFSPQDHTTPVQIIPLSFQPVVVAVGDFDGMRLLAVGGNAGFELFSITETEATSLAKHEIPSLKALTIGGPFDSHVLAATSDSLLSFTLEDNELVEGEIISLPYNDQWPNVFRWNAAFVKAADGRIYFPTDTDNRLLALDPAADVITVAGKLPYRTKAIAFGPSQTLHSSNYEKLRGGHIIHKFTPSGNSLMPAGDLVNTPLYANDHVPVWGMLWHQDGMLVRVLEPGYQKGWTALAIKQITADGQLKPFLDFGQLFAIRTRFSPWEATYSFKHDRDGNLIFTARPLKAVYKISPEGAVIWEAGLTPQGSADTISFVNPRDLAIDSRNRVWVSDYQQDKLFCLSTEGKLLYQYGKPAGVDDNSGAGFDQPAGMEVVQADEKNEYLYVGDSGNQRILKYQIYQ